MIWKNFEIRNDLAEIEVLATQLLELCRNNGIDEDVCFEIGLALEEAVSNTIKYGYEDDQVHMIQVRARMEDQRFLLEIEDDGKAFNPLEKRDPDFSLPVDKKPIGGLGIYLVRSLMDHVEYRRNGGRNLLRLTKFASVKKTLTGI
jgi:anti-sigma regulatory factor (Ser/Thr protein kinase)